MRCPRSARWILIALALGLGACPQDLGMPGPGLAPDEGTQQNYDPSDPRSRQDVCGNGLDEDRDGHPDDECGCDLGQSQPCYILDTFSGLGTCQMGVQSCEDGPEFPDWGECTGSVLPVGEVCGNGLDEDCDGADLPCPGQGGGDGIGPGDDDTSDDTGGDGQRLPSGDGDGGDADADADGDTGDGGGGGVGGDDTGPIRDEEIFVYGEDPVARKVDFVWAVDQSSSMSEEIGLVRANLNHFAEQLGASGLDYHVTLIAARHNDHDHHEICVPEPLAGPACADGDRFRQIDQHVDSEDALQKIEQNIGTIDAFAREGSLRAFVVVTDDDSDESAWAFDGFLLDHGGYTDYVFDAFVGIDDDFCDDIADEGDQYVTLAALSGGRAEQLCTQWDLALDRFVADALAQTASYELPSDPDPATLEVSVDRGAGFEPLDDALWDFEAPRTIQLTPEAALENGDEIRVTYFPA